MNKDSLLQYFTNGEKMGLDGFSMANLGLYNRLTSAQMSNEAETIAAQGTESQIKDIDAASKRKGIERKEMDFSETGGQAFLGGDTTEETDEELLPEPEIELTDEEDDLEHSPNRFDLRVNQELNIVELYDNYLQATVQRLSTKDMIQMIKKFDDPAGIMVNKKA